MSFLHVVLVRAQLLVRTRVLENTRFGKNAASLRLQRKRRKIDAVHVQELEAEAGGGMIDTWPSQEEGALGQRADVANSMRQPHLLCALPADTPACLLFGLLLPLSMGWHVTLGAAPVDDTHGDLLWNVLCGECSTASSNAPEATVPYDACYIASAACDILTRRTLEVLGGRACSAGGVGGSAAFSAALSKLAVCALFGPSATPATVQSFVASMLPFGLR
jgi:hypothetical protein